MEYEEISYEFIEHDLVVIPYIYNSSVLNNLKKNSNKLSE